MDTAKDIDFYEASIGDRRWSLTSTVEALLDFRLQARKFAGICCRIATTFIYSRFKCADDCRASVIVSNYPD